MAYQMKPMPLQWRGLDIHGTESFPIASALHQELESWCGTPYMIGQQQKGVGVDCVRFVAAIIGWATQKTIDIKLLPPDAALHNRKTAIAAMKKLSRAFDPLEPIYSMGETTVEPGDIIVVGPHEGGPGHAIIVGCLKNWFYEAGSKRVQRIGAGLEAGVKVFEVYRHKLRHSWPTT